MSSSYLVFTRDDVPGRRTPIVHVYSKSSTAPLGKIAWYSPWRQFCFWPERDTLFNVGCMTDIQQKIAELQAERKR